MNVSLFCRAFAFFAETPKSAKIMQDYTITDQAKYN